ncbi:MAG: hypothetical protein HY881_10370 [Deltaproteobacteria bacterium]|nr:hypothetical protein [Deltaproteobacteria bacterium]
MSFKTIRRQAARISSALLIGALILSVSASCTNAREYTQVEKNAYFAAIKNAQTPTQQEVFRGLLAIVPGDDRINAQRLHGEGIRWEAEPGNSRVLVVSFMSRANYEKYYRDNLEQHQESYALKKSLWVTVVPEMSWYFSRKPFCPPSEGRMIQALGLNPAMDYEVLLELWVNPGDLFRPSPDPEITDHESELAVQIGENQWILPSDTNPFVKLDNTQMYMDSAWSTPVTFRDWFVNRAQTIYTTTNEADPATWGWPWTRLGYTYDWGNPFSAFGLSEFILKINPNQNGGEVTVKLEKAVDILSSEWNQYFHCGTDDPDARND